MGREIRKVPPNWQHPTKENGQLQPMYDRHIDDELAQWLKALDAHRRGEWSDFEREVYTSAYPLAEWLNDEGRPPDPTYHRPWRDEDATWFQVWETVSEGTPVTPPFATREELVDYLVANGDFWDQKRGRGGYPRAVAEKFVSAGWAPSMVMTIGGPKHGHVASGIEVPAALAKDGA